MRDVAGLHAYGLGACPVDFKEERGIVKRLLHVHVHGARNVAELIGEIFTDQVGAGVPKFRICVTMSAG